MRSFGAGHRGFADQFFFPSHPGDQEKIILFRAVLQDFTILHFQGLGGLTHYLFHEIAGLGLAQCQKAEPGHYLLLLFTVFGAPGKFLDLRNLLENQHDALYAKVIGAVGSDFSKKPAIVRGRYLFGHRLKIAKYAATGQLQVVGDQVVPQERDRSPDILFFEL